MLQPEVFCKKFTWSSFQRKLFVTGVSGLLIAFVGSCQKTSSEDDPTPTDNLALTGGGSTVKAPFTFPNGHNQYLAAPKDHPIEGSSVMTSPYSFEQSLTIEIREAMGLTGDQIINELHLPDALSSAGPAILFSASPAADAIDSLKLGIPVKTSDTPEGKNLIVLYRSSVSGVGGKIITGMLAPSQISREGNVVSFYAKHFGIYQVAWYSGDPSKVTEQVSTGAILSLDDAKAEAPGEFLIRTPSGIVTGQFPQATWGISSGAMSYDVVVSDDNNCSKVVKRYPAIANLTRTIESLPDGNYFLCVTAVSRHGTRTPAKNNGLAFSVKYDQLGFFAMTSNLYYATLKPTLSWAASSGATTYKVTVGSNQGCTNVLESDTTTATTWTMNSSKRDGVYYVCVLATDDYGRRKWIDSDAGRPAGEGVAITIDTTAPGQFDIIGLGGPSGKLNWQASSEALYYTITVARNDKCTDVVKSFDRIAGSNTQIQVNGLEDGRAYYVCMSSLDAAGNTRVANRSGTAFVYDVTSPRVVSVTTSTPSGRYAAGQNIDVTVKFSESVKLTASGTPTISLNSNGVATYVSGQGSASWNFRYVVGQYDNSSDLNYTSTGSFNVSNLQPTDNAGNSLIVDLPTPSSQDSLGGKNDIVIDTVAPSISAISPYQDATDAAVDSEITIVYSEEITPNSADSVVTVTKDSDSSSVTKNFVATYNSDSKTLKLSPKSGTGLVAKTSYTVTARAVKDLAGNSGAEKKWRFTTK